MLETKGVSKRFGGLVALRDVDLRVSDGEIVGLVGPNGAGKTTLLKACLGLIPHQSGEIRCDFGGRPPAYVPQQKQLDPIYPVSVRDLVRMGLYPELGCWGRLNGGQRARAEAVMARFGLVPHQHKHFGELSGGLRQKTLLARAVVSPAEVLVLESEGACILEVTTGKADVFIYDQMSIYKAWQTNPDTTRANLEPFAASPENWGIGLRKGEEELKEKINAFIRESKGNGFFASVAEKYLSDMKAVFDELGIPFFF